MSKQKPTLNEADIELLETKFVTKKELRKIDDKINRKLDLIINTFDREYLHLEKRVTRVEKHLDLSPLPPKF